MKRGDARRATVVLGVLAGLLASPGLAAVPGADTLQLDATVYLNRMPTVSEPGQKRQCRSLIVVFSVQARGGRLPALLVPHTVTLHQPGRSRWRQPVSAGETRVEAGPPPVLRGVARGCPAPYLSPGDRLTLEVALTAGRQRLHLRRPVVLGTAY
ncbi:hypothetical protein N8I74_17305 [Chitiniphilus purpureus]|uniref:Uncharacterized protein n=1 Tax=Chitiniphilus purpureus TaxID=2981137 RepID=A0ABY6DL21_9NEIS|nr:hypothetical protein [Chitiniphilus sp. CD1]UXY15049.1 hypothetical protein N8I74_17305 [Chitiniphilus sp. CD1]